MINFKPGDTVRLKGGSPNMTVEFVEKGRVTCVWVDENGGHHDAFRFDALEIVTDRKQGDAGAN